MSLLEQIEQDLITAMKSGDDFSISTLRMLKAALKNKEIQIQKELEESDVIGVVQSQIKSRMDSVEMYQKGGRAELAEKEEKEIEILKNYLPAQLTEEEIKIKIAQIITKTGAQNIQDMGKVMAKAAEVFHGQADMGLVSRIVKDSLNPNANWY